VRVFVLKGCVRAVRKTDLNDADMMRSVAEITAGLVDAELGGGLVKKRIARAGSGKRDGFRTIIAFRSERRAFFLHCFAKNEQGNISGQELIALKKLAKQVMSYSDNQLDEALKHGALVEIEDDGSKP
jgi:hypothetical protein